jgi:2',3'-cyclic-nucleotide 2'-phosphodiesterase (5'-nucleotidase family)
LPFAICFSAGTAVTAAAEISSPNLPFGDVNVVVVTDVHSWVGGHGGGDDDDDAADYGDVLSFYERLREHCRGAGRDLWFVMNGDWIDGTGLAMNGDISRLVPLLQKMPWDAVNVGNHELYRERVVQSMMQTSGWIEWWRPKYLSSNVLHAVSQEPIGNRYRVLRGKNWSVLTFGFLYNMDNAVGSVTVRKVEEAVEEEWFVSALENEQYDAIMVLSHMDVRDPSVATILSKIRSTVGSDNVPVQFVTGHTHIRDYDRPDAASASFEAGRYLDTVGFASFPARTSLAAATGAATDDDNASSSALFQYTYLDASVPVLADALGVSPLATENGLALSDFIKTVREEMGLTKVIGCLSQSYYLNRTLEDADSLWRFFRDTIVPEQFDENLALLLGKGGWRYDLLKGELRVE